MRSCHSSVLIPQNLSPKSSGIPRSCQIWPGFLVRELETIRYLPNACLSTPAFHSLFGPCLMLQKDRFPTFRSLSFHLAVNPLGSCLPRFSLFSHHHPYINLFFFTDARNYGYGRSHQTWTWTNTGCLPLFLYFSEKQDSPNSLIPANILSPLFLKESTDVQYPIKIFIQHCNWSNDRLLSSCTLQIFQTSHLCPLSLLAHHSLSLPPWEPPAGLLIGRSPTHL